MLELYQKDPYLKSMRTRVLDVTSVKKKPALNLADNILYPGGGGQPHDTGWITLGAGRRLAVTRVLKLSGRIYAVVADDAEVSPGDELHVEVDWEPRYRNMRCHSSTHVLNAVLARSVQGYVSHGIEVAEDALTATSRFQGAWPGAREAAVQYIQTANGIVAEGRSVAVREFPSINDAIAEFPSIFRGTTALEGPVSIAVIDGWDANPCGGTHVRNSSEVGPLELLDFGPTHVRFSLRP